MQTIRSSVLWSDHGYHHGEKGDWGKHTLWERTSNVPFIWAGPGVANGKKSDVTVSLIDMYPTLVDVCGLPKPVQNLEGESLARTLAVPDSAKDRNVLLPHMHPGEYAVINRDWRYIRYGEDGEELYDLKVDPNEWHNLASDPNHAARKAELKKFAPKTFADPVPNQNTRKDLVVKGDTFHWEKGKAITHLLPNICRIPAAQRRHRRRISNEASRGSTPRKKRMYSSLFATTSTRMSDRLVTNTP